MQGNGASIILISPKSKVLEYSLQFTFSSSNNVAKNKALIASLAITKKLKVQRVTTYNDSQLVVQQFQRNYEARDPTLTRYLQKL